MQVKNEKAWLELKLGYVNINEQEGKSITDFAERWADLIEEVLGEQTVRNFREAMDMTVSRLDTDKIPITVFAEVLAILSQAWIYGEELVGNLTHIEYRLFEFTILSKLLALEELAANEDQ